jgi:hypothetical protein
MTVLQHIACPCGIIRAIVILTMARLLLSHVQEFWFHAESRLGAFLLLAVFLDVISRGAGIIAEISKTNDEKGKPNLKAILTRSIQGLSSSNYGGLILVPVWFGCGLIYIFKCT